MNRPISTVLLLCRGHEEGSAIRDALHEQVPAIAHIVNTDPRVGCLETLRKKPGDDGYREFDAVVYFPSQGETYTTTRQRVRGINSSRPKTVVFVCTRKWRTGRYDITCRATPVAPFSTEALAKALA